MLWMPPMAAMSALAAVAVVMSLWSGFVLKEKAGDERELLHRMNAGRVAYLSGIATLTMAVLWQGFTLHHIDPWVAFTLIVMVSTKIISRTVLEKYR